MPDLDRREFLSVFVAAFAAAAVPAFAGAKTWQEPRPEIGTEFYTVDFVKDGLTADEWRAVGTVRKWAMRRVEDDRGVRLGNYVHDERWEPDRQAWVVTTAAEVIGYA